MPGIMWYFVIALIVLVAVMMAVPSDGAEIPRGFETTIAAQV
jgi:hypothetical protein